MPISFKVLQDARAIHVKCTGIVSLEEIVRYEMAVVADPQFDAGYVEVFDLRDVEKLAMSRDDVEQIIGYERSHQRYVGSRKVAFIAPADLEFGLVRMYEFMEEESPMETQVFRDAESACEWTGLSVADLDAG